ncbi:MAG: acyl-CoA dehydrogenase N-terminal domain-containing protein [Rhodospirillales bacterium]
MPLEYSAPIRDLRFVLENLCDLEELSSHDGFEDANSEMVATMVLSDKCELVSVWK